MMTPAPRLVVAEDNHDDLMILLRVLEKHQLLTRVSVVENGAELLAYLQRHGDPNRQERMFPTVVLLDLNMPVMTGQEALRVIKGSDSLKHVPVLIFATVTSDTDVAYCYDTGANAFIEKPYSLEAYEKVIAAVRDFWLETARIPLA